MSLGIKMVNSDKQSQKFNIKEMSEELLNLLPDMILVKGPQSHILWANKAFQEYYGMTNKQLQGIIDSPVSKPDHTQQYIKDDMYVFTTGKTLNIPEEPVTKHDGTVRYFHTIKSAIRNDAGKVIMTIGVSRDITEHKKAVQARKESEDKLKKHNQDIEKINQLMVGRELKMIELKKQLAELKKGHEKT